jgi:signal transduction histidine kinase
MKRMITHTRKDWEADLHPREIEVQALASQLIRSHENERIRLSRELHDDIGQQLSLVTSEIAAIIEENSAITPSLIASLKKALSSLDRLCSDVHELSHGLHSHTLKLLGLKPALKDLCLRLSQPLLRVHLDADHFEEPISEEVALCLYRVAQEALNNVVRHSRSKVVALTLTKIQNRFYLTIQDSGIGFDTSNTSIGLGLLNMSERVKLVGGKFKIKSAPEEGTEIWVEVTDSYR